MTLYKIFITQMLSFYYIIEFKSKKFISGIKQYLGTLFDYIFN